METSAALLGDRGVARGDSPRPRPSVGLNIFVLFFSLARRFSLSALTALLGGFFVFIFFIYSRDRNDCRAVWVLIPTVPTLIDS